MPDSCYICGRPIFTCCDVYFPLVDDKGSQVGIVCMECSASEEFETEE